MRQTDFHSFRNTGGERAIVFVHGLSGDLQQSWEPMVTLLAAEPDLNGYDIYSFGYHSSFVPPTFWAGNASLTSLAIQLYSRLELREMAKYKKLALIGHSSGGLVIQKALVSYPQLVAKTSHVCLFATPSGGARSIYWRYHFWNPQLRDLRGAGPFLQGLRREWSDRFEQYTSFWFRVVAGEQDHFVPVESVIGPYAKDFVRMYAGDHISLIRPEDRSAGPIQLLVDGLRISPGAGQNGSAPCDAFLSYNRQDATEATKLADALGARKLRIWMDNASLRPGEAWAIALETVAKSSPAAVIAVGPHGLGKTQEVEIHQFGEGCKLIPVILPTCTEIPKLPAALQEVQWVDLRKEDALSLYNLEHEILAAGDRRARGAAGA